MSLFVFLLLYFCSFSSSSPSCPYALKTLPHNPVFVLKSWNFGSVGNRLICAEKALYEAIRCKTTLTIENLKLFTKPLPAHHGFDFSQRIDEVNDTAPCPTRFRKTCQEYYQTLQDRRSQMDQNTKKLLHNCMGVLLDFSTLECPDMTDKLLIHIRNGDVYSQKVSNFPPQAQFSALLGPLYAKSWKQFVVISSITTPQTKWSGPIYDMFRALKVFLPAPSFLPPSKKYEDHLRYWFCAENLVTSVTTLNTALPLHQKLKTVFTPALECIPNGTTIEKIPSQYRVPSAILDLSKVTGKIIFALDEENYAKLALSSSPPYELCLNTSDQNKNRLFQWQHQHQQQHSQEPAILVVHENLADCLIIDLGLNVSIASPFCAIFGAIMFQEWKRVIVLEYQNDVDSIIKQVLVDGIKMLNGSIPVRFVFMSAERFHRHNGVTKVVNVATLEPNYLLQDGKNIQRVFNISGLGCKPSQPEGTQVSIFTTQVTKIVKATRPSLLFTQCAVPFTLCTSISAQK